MPADYLVASLQAVEYWYPTSYISTIQQSTFHSDENCSRGKLLTADMWMFRYMVRVRDNVRVRV